jgi:hypothetical protein
MGRERTGGIGPDLEAAGHAVQRLDGAPRLRRVGVVDQVG